MIKPFVVEQRSFTVVPLHLARAYCLVLLLPKCPMLALIFKKTVYKVLQRINFILLWACTTLFAVRR